MNAWAAGFENWADCDTVCFKLFDRTPFAWEKARQWSASPREFVKRGGFVLMACLALHDKAAPDESFLALLPLIEKGAHDERNFVKKGVSWALRAIGRRNLALNAAALEVAKRLALSEEAACRWVGKDALRELASPKVRAQLARRARTARDRGDGSAGSLGRAIQRRDHQVRQRGGVALHRQPRSLPLREPAGHIEHLGNPSRVEQARGDGRPGSALAMHHQRPALGKLVHSIR